MYGNGSLSRGREKRYRLWFDPTQEFHRFYVDEIPIRDIIRNDAMGSDYPAKPMSMYATIWDASTWATNGGKGKVDYTFEPFSAEFQDFVIQGCAFDPIQQISPTNCTDTALKLAVSDYFTIKPHQSLAMQRFREKYMYYSHCYDYLRYPVPQSECGVVPSEQKLFKESGRLREAMKMKFGGSHRRHRRGRNSKRRSRGGPVGLVSSKEVGGPGNIKNTVREHSSHKWA